MADKKFRHLSSQHSFAEPFGTADAMLSEGRFFGHLNGCVLSCALTLAFTVQHRKTPETRKGGGGVKKK